MSYAFARFAKVDCLAFLGAMERHAKREDSSALRVDKSRTDKALLYSPYNEDDKRGIVQAFKNMKKETGASERGKNAFGAHLLLCVSPEWIAKHGNVHDPENPANQALFRCAIDYAEEKFGKGSVIHARLDVDEEGSGVVDVITIPMEEIKTCGGKKTALKCLINKPMERMISETGTPKTYGAGTRALQTSWHEYASRRLDRNLERGRPVEKTGRKHVHHTIFADAAESIKRDKEKNARNADYLLEMRAELKGRDVSVQKREYSVSVKEKALKEGQKELRKTREKYETFSSWWGRVGVGLSSIANGMRSIKRATERAFKAGREAGREDRQGDVDKAEARAKMMERERDRAREDLKQEQADRAKDFVLPKREHAEYAKWKMEQRTKNAPSQNVERQRGYGHEF